MRNFFLPAFPLRGSPASDDISVEGPAMPEGVGREEGVRREEVRTAWRAVSRAVAEVERREARALAGVSTKMGVRGNTYFYGR